MTSCPKQKTTENHDIILNQVFKIKLLFHIKISFWEDRGKENKNINDHVVK